MACAARPRSCPKDALSFSRKEGASRLPLRRFVSLQTVLPSLSIGWTHLPKEESQSEKSSTVRVPRAVARSARGLAALALYG